MSGRAEPRVVSGPGTAGSWLEELLSLGTIAAAALLAVLPLMLWGASCGHDLSFHLQNWMEVGAQWRAGILWPRWAVQQAWGAGEPRFLFYPPLSWIFGAALARLLPLPATPVAYTFFALLLSGWTMQRLARRFTSVAMATMVGCIYLANPYMLFVAYERTAFAELLAAAWMPLLLAAMLRVRPDPIRLAIAIALLWITNAPAAVIGCYGLLLLSAILLILRARGGEPPGSLLRYTAGTAAGAALGLAAAAFYILPAAYERRFVQISMAMTEGLHPSENFLFGHGSNALHDEVLRTASWNAVALLLAAFACSAAFFVRFRSKRTEQPVSTADAARRQTVLALTCLCAIVLLLLLPVSRAVWSFAPELAFLQFPWRFLSLISGVASLLLALALPRWRKRFALPLGLTLALAAGLFAHRVYRQACDEEDIPSAQGALFQAGYGSEPTDEYTPEPADNDALARRSPELWMTDGADGGPPPGPAASPSLERSPTHLHVQVASRPAPCFLILRLRGFYGWHVLDNGVEVAGLPDREDGLIAIPLAPSASHSIDVRYRWTMDQWAGLGITLLALSGGGVCAFRRRRSSLLPRLSSKSADESVL